MAEKRVDTLQKAHDYAKRHELESGGCAQCCLAGVFEALGVEIDDGLFMAATGLADGVGLTGDGHCGALSGGVLAIGYFFGRPSKEFGNMKKQIKACILAKSLHDMFVEKHGTCRCADLQEKLAGRFFCMIRQIWRKRWGPACRRNALPWSERPPRWPHTSSWPNRTGRPNRPEGRISALDCAQAGRVQVPDWTQPVCGRGKKARGYSKGLCRSGVGRRPLSPFPLSNVLLALSGVTR